MKICCSVSLHMSVLAWSDITTTKGIPVASFEDIDQLRKKGFVKKYKVQKETVGYGI